MIPANLRDIENAELRNAEAGWNRVLLGYAPYVCLGLLLCTAIPDNGLPWPATRALVDEVAGVVPSINRLAVLSPLPDMTRVFGALMWLAYPAFTVMGCLRAPRVPRRVMPWFKLVVLFPLCGGTLVLLGVLVPFFFIADAPTPATSAEEARLD